MICCSHGKSEEEDCIDCDRDYYGHTRVMLECDRRVHSCRLWHVIICTPGTCWGEKEQDDER